MESLFKRRMVSPSAVSHVLTRISSFSGSCSRLHALHYRSHSSFSSPAANLGHPHVLLLLRSDALRHLWRHMHTFAHLMLHMCTVQLRNVHTLVHTSVHYPCTIPVSSRLPTLVLPARAPLLSAAIRSTSVYAQVLSSTHRLPSAVHLAVQIARTCMTTPRHRVIGCPSKNQFQSVSTGGLSSVIIKEWL